MVMVVNNHKSKDEESIFNAALELASPDERTAYLRKACGNDQDLLNRVQALLELNEIEDGFLEEPPTICDVLTGGQIQTEAPGTVIGRTIAAIRSISHLVRIAHAPAHSKVNKNAISPQLQNTPAASTSCAAKKLQRSKALASKTHLLLLFWHTPSVAQIVEAPIQVGVYIFPIACNQLLVAVENDIRTIRIIRLQITHLQRRFRAQASIHYH
jgi:hypothetical protein